MRINLAPPRGNMRLGSCAVYTQHMDLLRKVHSIAWNNAEDALHASGMVRAACGCVLRDRCVECFAVFAAQPAQRRGCAGRMCSG